ncbi:MAG: DNA polymerase I [Pseudomonadota bacterium]
MAKPPLPKKKSQNKGNNTAVTYHLVDVSAFIFRAFHTIPMRVRRRDGGATNAIYGFSSMMMKLLEDPQITHLGLVMDAAGDKTFRKDMYPDYKANRPPPPQELIEQWPLIEEVAHAFGLPVLVAPGWEADDLMAAYARDITARGGEVVLISSDKDLMQLVDDKVTMFDPIKEKMIDIQGVIDKFGVPPELVTHVQALAGDSTDNIPGVRGIGIKTAAQLIQQFGSLEDLLSGAETIPQPKRREALIAEADMARLSHKLVALDKDAPLPVSPDALAVGTIDGDRLVAFFIAQEFPSLVNRARARYQTSPSGTSKADEGKADGVQEHEDATDEHAQIITEPAALAHWCEAAAVTGRLVVVILAEAVRPYASEGFAGLALAAGGRTCYLPCCVSADGLGLGEGTGNHASWQQADLVEALTPIMGDPAVLKVAFDGKALTGWWGEQGVPVTPVADVMLMAYALAGGSGDLAAVAWRWLEETLPPLSELTGTGRGKIRLSDAPGADLAAYGADQAHALMRLARRLPTALAQEGVMSVYEAIDRPLIGVTAAMESAGIAIDPAVLARLGKDFAKRLADEEAKIHQQVGRDFNVGSPKQLGVILFEEMGLPGGKKNKSGGYNTSSAVLEPMAAQGIEIAERVLAWRHIAKLKSTYIDTLGDNVSSKTGRIHTTYALATTATGRLSSNHPNLQNIPIRTADGLAIRQAFVAPEGQTFICVDYSQIELRVAAHMTGAALLIDAFKQGQDIHARTAREVFGESGGDARHRAKAINFGIIYGISGFGLGQQLGIGRAQAQRFIDDYLARLPELKQWMDETKAQARERGYVLTEMGRRCKITGLQDPRMRQFAERQAINAPIQGTAADLIRLAMARVAASLPDVCPDARLLLQVHDELVIQAPQDAAQAVAAATCSVMEQVADLRVPLVAVANIGPTWADAH